MLKIFVFFEEWAELLTLFRRSSDFLQFHFKSKVSFLVYLLSLYQEYTLFWSIGMRIVSDKMGQTCKKHSQPIPRRIYQEG
jgi:hypothetical protein